MTTTVNKPASPDYGTEVDDGVGIQEPVPNARQGVTHQNVRYVLALSLAGIVIVFALVYLSFFWR